MTDIEMDELESVLEVIYNDIYETFPNGTRKWIKDVAPDTKVDIIKEYQIF